MKELAIDSTVGGLGDIWMRLAALHSLTVLKPGLRLKIKIPGHLLAIARTTFPDRIEFGTESLPGAWQFSHLGLRHLLPRVWRGERFICPFTRLMQADRKQIKIKDVLNDALFALVGATGKIKQPTADTVECYQGFHELSAINALQVDWSQFQQQMERDLTEIRTRLQKYWPPSREPEFNVLVFPGGSAHQVMPPAWAKDKLPGATFAFHANDSFQSEFEGLGLTLLRFSSTEELIALVAKARWTLVTDSFPSHIVQTYTDSSTLMLTEQVPPRTIHPSFKGRVVRTTASCAPCKHIARTYSKCEQGHAFCVTWWDQTYTKTLLATVS